MISGILPVSIGIYQEQNQQLITVLAVYFDQFSEGEKADRECLWHIVCVCSRQGREQGGC